METTPLLSHSPPSSGSPPLPSSARITALTIVSIATSTLSFLYTLTTSIWIKSSPNAPNLDWATGECANYSILSAFSLALHIARHRKDPTGPFAFFAFAVDFVIGWFGVGIAALGFQELYYTPACPSGASADIGVERGCRSAVVDILLRFGCAFGVALGVIHALFVLRALVSAVRYLRQGCSTWRFPTGQFTFEFTVKVLRQEEGRNSELLAPQP
ncbi:hypothetical protein PEBR_34190 [Penicillium brasilianum]|uniref:Uncharacterized protein n=1 Tax=Penicillium brasilianum TaxID=104259 RepID=A0A1S9RGX4_PENBI|nr:hypothetical protein PEBR_34190 [Penicillium brasilianum]